MFIARSYAEHFAGMQDEVFNSIKLVQESLTVLYYKVLGKILYMIIIGASGYIGKSLYDYANRYGNNYGTSSNGGNGLLPLRLDKFEEFNYEIVQAGDVILFTAAISSPDICVKEYNRAWSVNVTGTSGFISRVLSRGGKVIFFSSDTVYGEKTDDFDESSVCAPAGPYAEMKHEIENRFSGNPLFKILRLSYVFSRGDKFTKYLASCSENNEEAEIFDPFFRAVIHRDDVIAGAVALGRRWNEFPQSVLNFGGPEVLSRTEFARILKEVRLHSLKYRIVEPATEFFKSRPKIIRMASPVLSELLDRPGHTLHEAAIIEFK